MTSLTMTVLTSSASSGVAPSGVWRRCTPCMLLRQPFLLFLFLLAVSSDHLSVLCFNPLVAASSAAAAASSPSSRASRPSSHRASSTTPYNLTITTVDARAATVHWEPTPAIIFFMLPNNNRSSGGTTPSSYTAGDYGTLPPITGFRVTLKPTYTGGGRGGSSSNVNAGGIGNDDPLSPTPSSSSAIGMQVMNTPRVVDLEGHRRSFSFQDLAPRTEYQVVIVAYSGEGRGNVSDMVTFTTLHDDDIIIARSLVRPTEVVLVILILVAWFCAIALFLHQWGKIRVIQPREPRFKHSPKNLDTIKVVKKPTDSVIHKHYTRQVSRTMLLRETKRLERMNTMPNIKVNLEPLPHQNAIGRSADSKSAERLHKKFQTMPEIELENLSSGDAESQT